MRIRAWWLALCRALRLCDAVSQKPWAPTGTQPQTVSDRDAGARLSASPPATEDAREAITPLSLAVQPRQLRVGVAQSAGRLRHNNEDALFTWSFTAAGAEQAFWGGLFIVADGMGGHLHGEQASQFAVYTFAHALLKGFFLPWLKNWEQPPPDALPSLETALELANQAVREHAQGGGTTLTAALIWRERLLLIHVGDSRAYYLSPEGQLQVLTTDHSLVARWVAQGELTPEEAAQHPQRNMLYQALGQDTLAPDVSIEIFPAGGVLLLCSDGLWDELPQDRIAALLQAYRHDPVAAAQHLVREAEAAGGRDNITAVVIHQVSSYTSEHPVV